MRHAVIAGVSSGIGAALATHLAKTEWRVSGTSRKTHFKGLAAVHTLQPCDFAVREQVTFAAQQLRQNTPPWNLLVMAPGTMMPIAMFKDACMVEWTEAIHVNFLNQLLFVRCLLEHAVQDSEDLPRCIFLAGGGTNSAPAAYSAYTLSKIALMKATELLDAEMADIAFSILGPGWVRTEIHAETLNAPAAPEQVRRETQRRLETNDFIEMDRVISAFEWLLNQPKKTIGGRNFAVSSDPFESPELKNALDAEPSAFKLRRFANNILDPR